MNAKETYNLSRLATEMQEIGHSIRALKQQSTFALSSIITNDELISKLGISRKTAFNWRQAGYLPFHKVGRRIFYKTADIARLLESNSTGVNSANHLLSMYKNQFDQQI
jgi:hypothetical protein